MTNEQVFEKLGQLTVWFSTLDFLTTTAIFKIVNANYKRTNAPLKTKTTLPLKFEYIERLKDSDVDNIDVLHDLKLIMPKAKNAAVWRNRFIHDQWIFDSVTLAKDEISRYQLIDNSSWSYDESRTMYTPHDIVSVLNDVANIQQEMLDICNRLD